MPKPILCLDFDGVIHSYISGWQGATEIPDRPVDGAMEFIREAQKHFTVAIFSSRSHVPGGIAAMQNWMSEWSPLSGSEWLDDIQWPSHKPPAFLTIDDRAIQFKGVWPEMEYLLKFRPWRAAEK